MQFSILALFATGAVANLLGSLCPSGLYSNPQCCGVNVLGIADLDCETPDVDAITGVGFRNVCAAHGKQAVCCVIPIAGQDLLCEKAQGQHL